MEAFWLALAWIAAAVLFVWIVGRAVELGRAWRRGDFAGSSPPMAPDELDERRLRGEISRDEYERERRR